MTAQESDCLEMDDRTFWVLEFIELPDGVDPPPEEVHVLSTSCWRGYMCRWAVRKTANGKELFLLGFDCEEYLPLYEPAIHALTTAVRVVPKGARVTNYVHMGFESKFEGECYLMFKKGVLVGIEPISDKTLTLDGLFDLARLHPDGEQAGLDEIRRLPKAGMSSNKRASTDPVVDSRTCSACRKYFLPDDQEHYQNWGVDVCPSCVDDLIAVGRQLTRWEIDESSSKSYGRWRLSAPPTSASTSKADAHWHRRSRVRDFAYLRMTSDSVTIEVHGVLRSIPLPTVELLDDRENRIELKRSLDRLHTEFADRVKPLIAGSDGLQVQLAPADRSVDGLAWELWLENELSVSVPLVRREGHINAESVARSLEGKLDRAIQAWLTEMRTPLPGLRRDARKLLWKLTEGTGIFPYDPARRTPRDERILVSIVNRMPNPRGSRWAIPPRHTKSGWLAGVTLQDRYLSSLNL